MEFIMFYVIFALTTTIMSLYTIFMPIVKDVYSTEPKPKITETSKFVLYLGLCIASLLFAPIMFFVCLSPNMSLKFMNSLAADLKKN